MPDINQPPETIDPPAVTALLQTMRLTLLRAYDAGAADGVARLVAAASTGNGAHIGQITPLRPYTRGRTAAFWAALSRLGEVCVSDVSAEGNIPPKAAANIIGSLLARGKIRRVRPGVYAAVEG